MKIKAILVCCLMILTFNLNSFYPFNSLEANTDNNSAVNNSSTNNRSMVKINISNNKIDITASNLEWPPDLDHNFKLFLEKKINHHKGRKGEKVHITLTDKNAKALQKVLMKYKNNMDALEGDRAWKELKDNFDFGSIAIRISEAGNKEKVIIGEVFKIEENEIIDDLVIIGATGEIKGRVNNLVAIGSDLTIANTAVIDGDLFSLGSDLTKHPSAKISAQQVSMPFPTGKSFWKMMGSILEYSHLAWYVNLFWSLAILAVAWLLGSLYLYYFPNFHHAALDHLVNQKMASFGLGVMGFLVFFPIMILLIITVVGLLIVPIYIIIYTIFVFLGYITCAFLLVKAVPALANLNKYQALALGLIALKLIGLIPFIGCLFVMIISIMGFGAVAAAFWNKSKKPEPA